MDARGERAKDRRGFRQGDESGAAAMTLIVVVSILLLGFAMMFGVRLSKATDQASGLQGAADAAALAGAQSILDDAPGQIVSALVSGESIPCGLGQGEASDFAGRNDATLVSYCYYPTEDRVQVTVRSKKALESGEREERSASAGLGLALGPCSSPSQPPTPSTSTSSTSSTSSNSSTSSTNSTTTTPHPPDDVQDTVSCGGLDIPITWESGPGGIWDMDVHVDAGLIKDLDLEPALAAD